MLGSATGSLPPCCQRDRACSTFDLVIRAAPIEALHDLFRQRFLLLVDRAERGDIALEGDMQVVSVSVDVFRKSW